MTRGAGPSLRGIVYVVTNPAWPEWVKIGRTRKGTKERLSRYQYGSPYTDYEIQFSIEVEDHYLVEDVVHDRGLELLGSNGSLCTKRRHVIEAAGMPYMEEPAWKDLAPAIAILGHEHAAVRKLIRHRSSLDNEWWHCTPEKAKAVIESVVHSLGVAVISTSGLLVPIDEPQQPAEKTARHPRETDGAAR